MTHRAALRGALRIINRITNISLYSWEVWVHRWPTSSNLHNGKIHSPRNGLDTTKRTPMIRNMMQRRACSVAFRMVRNERRCRCYKHVQTPSKRFIPLRSPRFISHHTGRSLDLSLVTAATRKSMVLRSVTAPS